MLNIGIGGFGGRAILEAAARLSAPVLIEAPRIGGVAEVGQTLTATTGRWSDDATLFALQWRRNGVAVVGATTPLFPVTTDDVGAALDVVVTATNAARRSADAVSEAIRPSALLAFSPADWSVRTAAEPGALIVSIATLPWPVGETQTHGVEWSADGGATVAPAPAMIGNFTIADLPGGAPASISLRPVSDGRPQAWSAAKTATPLADTPAMFAPSAWTLAATGVSGQLSIEILLLPDAYGSKIVRVERSVDGGPWIDLGVLTGGALIDGLPDDISVDVSVRAVSTSGNGEPSDASTATPFDVEQAPMNLVYPTIAGAGEIDAVLTVDPGIWRGPALLSFQWRRNGVAIAGETGKTYTLVAADRGALVDCVVTGVVEARTAIATTAQLAVNVLDVATFTANRPDYGSPSGFFGSLASGTWVYQSTSGWRRMMGFESNGLILGGAYAFSGVADLSGITTGTHALMAAVNTGPRISTTPVASHVFTPSDNTAGAQAFSVPFVANQALFYVGIADTQPLAIGENMIAVTGLRLARTDGAAASRRVLAVTGSGVIDLGAAVSHVEISGPPAATMIPAYQRAGLDAPTDAHIYRVTSTSDASAPGTLRHALTDGTPINNPGDPTDGTTLAGPRVVVFDVAGIWNMDSRLSVTRPKTYVAGQTAPAHVILRGESVLIYASDIVIRHVSVIPDPPANTSESDSSKGLAVAPGGGPSPQSVERVWIDQWFVSGWADQAPSVYPSGTYQAHDCYLTNGMVAEGFKAPGSSGAAPTLAGWTNFHKAQHNLGMFFGQRTRNNVALNNIIAGNRNRTPQVKAASHSAIMSNYIHDFARQTDLETARANAAPAPIQISTANDIGDVSAFEGGAAVTVVAEGNWIEPGRDTRAGGFSLVGAAIERPASASISGFSVQEYHGDNRWEAGGATGWRLDRFINYEDGAGGTQPLGANNRAVTPLPNALCSILDTPTLWTEQAPTHVSETRAWTLAHSGPRPNDPHTMMDRLKATLAAQAAIDANTTYARGRLFRDEVTDPDGPAPASDDFSGEIVGPTAWTPPADPFATAANGRTNIENALEALNVALGGTPWGNVDRPLAPWSGGKVTVSADGVVTWDATEASADVMAHVTLADGETRRVTLMT